MLEDLKIQVARDFHTHPAGRDEHDGPNNGKRFREELLKPCALKAIEIGSKVVVDFTGVRSWGSSFLEEAFGGLVRDGVDSASLIAHLELTSERSAHKRYFTAVRDHIKSARRVV